MVVLAAPAAGRTVVPLDLSGGFNMDAVCGPREYQVCLADGDADLAELFGGMPAGNGVLVVADGQWLLAASNGPTYAYSLPGTAGHPRLYNADDGLPSDGVLRGADRLYHLPSVFGNATLIGDWTEADDPTTLDVRPNCITVGALHDRATWQIASVTVELPDRQKGSYETVNFVLAALDTPYRAAHMRIVALYGPDGTVEHVLHEFGDEGANAPLMTQAPPAGFAALHPFERRYSAALGPTGAIVKPGGAFIEFADPLPLETAEALWGFRIEDTRPELDGAARGLTIFAATASRPGKANTPPVANAGRDIMLVDEDGDGAAWVRLDGSGSADAEGPLLAHVWSDSVPLAVGVVPIVALTVGSHRVMLTVTDGDGATRTDVVTVVVAPPERPAPLAEPPRPPEPWEPPQPPGSPPPPELPDPPEVGPPERFPIHDDGMQPLRR